MMERPASVLRGILRSLAGGQAARLSVSFGEAVPAAAWRQAWERVAAVRPRLRLGYRSLPGEGLRAIEDPQGTPEWRALDWSRLEPSAVAEAWRKEFDSARAPEPSMAPPLRLTHFTLPDGTTHLLATHPQFVYDEEDWFEILCEVLEALEGRFPSPLPASPPARKPAGSFPRDFLQNGTTSPLKFYGPGELGSFDVRRDVSPGLAAAYARACREAGASEADGILACWSMVLGRLTGEPRPLLLAPHGEVLSLFQPFRAPGLTNPGLRELAGKIAAERRALAAAAPELLETFGLQPSHFTSLIRILPPCLNDRIAEALPRWVNLDARLHTLPLHRLELTARLGRRMELELRGQGLPATVAAEVLGWLEAYMVGLVEGRRAADLALDEPPAAALPPLPEAAPVEALLAEAAGAHLEVTAVEDAAGTALTFREMDQMASKLARWLCARNLGEGWVAGVCVASSIWEPVAWAGVLRAGNTLLPLDPSAPAPWLADKASGMDAQFVVCDSSTAPMFENSGLRVVMLDQEWESISSVPEQNGPFPQPAKMAILLGGTPLPPPPLAAIPRAALAAACVRLPKTLALHPGSRVAITEAPGTGSHCQILLGALAAGATLVSEGSQGITHLICTPGSLRARLQQQSHDFWQRLMVVAVNCRLEALHLKTLERLRRQIHGACRVILFASPCDIAPLGLVGEADPQAAVRNVLPVGCPGRASGAVFSDCLGRLPPPGFPGEMSFCPPGVSAAVKGLRAWRSATGAYYVIPVDEEAAAFEIAALAHPAVEDVVVEPGRAGDALWYCPPGFSPEQLAGHLARACPERKLPQRLVPLAVIPRQRGSPDWDHLRGTLAPGPRKDRQAPAPPPSPASHDAHTPQGQQAAPAPSSDPPSVPSPPAAETQNPTSVLIELAGKAELPRLIFVHASGRSPQDCAPLLPYLSPHWHIFGLRRYRGSPPDHSEIAAALDTDLLCEGEAFHIFGIGAGGVLALEVACALRERGRDVPFLVIAGAVPSSARARTWLESLGLGPRTPAAPRWQGPCGVLLTSDLPKDAESRWLDTAPDAYILRLSCRTQDLLGAAAHELARAMARLAGMEE